MKLLHTALFILILNLFHLNVFSQELQKRLELASPHDAIWVHLYYLQPEHYNPALASTVFWEGDSIERVDLAIKLKQIFDGEGLFMQMNLLPRETDYRDSVSNKPYYTPFPEALPQIYLERVDSQWHYSSESVGEIPDLIKQVYPMGTHRLVSYFARLGADKLFGISLWQLSGLAILVALASILYLIFAWSLRFMIKKLSKSIVTIEHYSHHVKRMASIGSLYLLFWVLKLFYPLLQFPPKVNMVVQTIFKIILAFLLAWLLIRVVKLFADYFKSITEKTESKMDDQILPIIRQILIIIISIVAILNILHILKFNITALIAGASIGGLALALAAQDTVKNFLGSVMIFTDKPFQIGDWVEGAGFAGSIVEVGFRSTRIKTSETSIISVPNGNMANISVTNRGVRQYRLFTATIGITYDTPPDLIEFFIKGLKEIIIHDPEVANDDFYVYFNDLGASSLNIFMRCYMKAPTYDDELRIRESIHFAIVRWAAKLGVRFAFPSQTLYVEEIPGQVSLSPTYKLDQSLLQKKWKEYFKELDEEIKSEG